MIRNTQPSVLTRAAFFVVLVWCPTNNCSYFSRFWFSTTRQNFLQTAPALGDLLQYPFDTGGPDKRFGVCIPSHQEIIDRLLQFRHASKSSAPHRLFTQFPKPSLAQVQPTGTGGNEVQHEPRVFGQPTTHSRVPVSSIVIQDQMQRNVPGKLPV